MASRKKRKPSNCKTVRQTAQNTDSVAYMLTEAEIESLRQDAKEASAFYKKAFAHLKTKTE